MAVRAISPVEARSTEGVTAALRDLRWLASSLGAGWDEMPPSARRGAIAGIFGVAAELNRLSAPMRPAEPRDEPTAYGGFSLLTARELEVLGALASGGSTESIGRSLQITGRRFGAT